MAENLRLYKYPGKFEGGLAIDEYIYETSLDGADEETGDVSENGTWYGLLRGSLDSTVKSGGNYVNRTELKFLKSQAGAIISEDDQGFVSVSYYKTTKALNKAWKEIEDEIEEFYDENEDEDEDY